MFAVAESDTSAERTAIVPVVHFINGTSASTPFAEVTRVVRSTGTSPSRAFITVRNSESADEISPAVALLTDGPTGQKTLKMWSRVMITYDYDTIFIGSLIRRRESVDELLALEVR